MFQAADRVLLSQQLGALLSLSFGFNGGDSFRTISGIENEISPHADVITSRKSFNTSKNLLAITLNGLRHNTQFI